LCLAPNTSLEAGGRAVFPPGETSGFASPPHDGFALNQLCKWVDRPDAARVEATGRTSERRRLPHLRVVRRRPGLDEARVAAALRRVADVPWADVDPAYGAATDVPALLHAVTVGAFETWALAPEDAGGGTRTPKPFGTGT
jgi:hypothetical protein